MVGHEGGRWDVGVKENAVYLERIADGEEQLFEDVLDPDEARALAGLLTKYADKISESRDSDDHDDHDDHDDDDDDHDDDDDDDDDHDDEGDDDSK
jgi:hypothetical protein